MSQDPTWVRKTNQGRPPIRLCLGSVEARSTSLSQSQSHRRFWLCRACGLATFHWSRCRGVRPLRPFRRNRANTCATSTSRSNADPASSLHRTTLLPERHSLRPRNYPTRRRRSLRGTATTLPLRGALLSDAQNRGVSATLTYRSQMKSSVVRKRWPGESITGRCCGSGTASATQPPRSAALRGVSLGLQASVAVMK